MCKTLLVEGLCQRPRNCMMLQNFDFDNALLFHVFDASTGCKFLINTDSDNG